MASSGSFCGIWVATLLLKFIATFKIETKAGGPDSSLLLLLVLFHDPEFSPLTLCEILW